MRCAAVALICFVSAAAAQAPVTVAVTVRNDAAIARHEVVRVSLPLSRGLLRPPLHVEVEDQSFPAVPLVEWPDGSVCVLQAHLRLDLDPGEDRVIPITVHPGVASGSGGEWPFVLPAMATEVVDPWGRVYRAAIRLEPPDPTLSTDLVRVQPFHALHERDGVAFLGLVGWLTTFRGSRRAELTVVLDDRAHLDVEPALGPVRFDAFALVVDDPHLRLRPRFTREDAIPAPQPRDGGGWRQPLLASSHDLYLGDRTAKAFRLDLFLDGPTVGDAEREAAAIAADQPLVAWPDVGAVRASGAFGAHGGPAPAADGHPGVRLARWREHARWGPFHGHGDPEDAAAQGTPRNGPSALHDTLRWRSAELLRVAETMVLQQGLRPTPGLPPRQPGSTAALRQGLPPTVLARPHGFTALDYEHVSVDLLYDWWWLTGDPWARAELSRVGSGLPALLERLPFRTARGEGWCLQAAVLIGRATGDRAAVAALAKRLTDEVLPELGPPPAGCVLPQPADVRAFGPYEPFDAPWQMAALVYGLHALWGETGDAEVAAAAVRVATVMAGPDWVEGVGPKYLVSALDPNRYIFPVGYEPLEGTALMEVGAFVLAGEMTDDATARAQFARRAATIALPHRAEARSDELASRWLQLWLDRQERP